MHTVRYGNGERHAIPKMLDLLVVEELDTISRGCGSVCEPAVDRAAGSVQRTDWKHIQRHSVQFPSAVQQLRWIRPLEPPFCEKVHHDGHAKIYGAELVSFTYTPQF